VVSFLAASLFIWTVFGANFETAIILQLFILALIPHAMQIEWLYNGLQIFNRITYSRMLQAIVYLLLLYYLAGPENLLLVPVFYTFSVLLAALLLLFLYEKKHLLNPFKTALGNIKLLIADGIKIGFGSLFAQFVILLPPLFIGYFLGNTHAGYYGAAFKLILLVMLFDRMITTLLLPNLSRLWKTKNVDTVTHLNILLKWAMTFSCTFALVLYFGSDRIIPLIFGEGFRQSAVILPVLSFFLPATFANSIFAYGLIATGNDSYYLKSAAKSGVFVFFILLFVSFIGNLSWISFAVVLSEITGMLFMYMYFIKVMKIDVQIPMIQISIFILVIMISVLFGIYHYAFSLFYIPIFYLILLFLFKTIKGSDLAWLSDRLFK
ncbi:MAG: oligosaccharide flippase family protein, partial [Balneolaceae bacterium]